VTTIASVVSAFLLAKYSGFMVRVSVWACASAEAGRIVHGERLGVLASYYDTRRILAGAESRFAWPESMLAGVGLSRTTQRRVELMAALDRIPDDRIDDVLRVTRALSE
jgi:hypothetical protein